MRVETSVDLGLACSNVVVVVVGILVGNSHDDDNDDGRWGRIIFVPWSRADDLTNRGEKASERAATSRMTQPTRLECVRGSMVVYIRLAEIVRTNEPVDGKEQLMVETTCETRATDIRLMTRCLTTNQNESVV